MNLFKERIIAFGIASAHVAEWGLPPAEVLAHACDSDASEADYLLAFDPAKDCEGWAHLGGSADRDETPAQTALREFDEESNCVYGMTLLGQQQLARTSTALTGFVTFTMKVPFVRAAVIESRDRARCRDVAREQWV